MGATDETLERIRTDFVQLRSQDTQLAIFGARSHMYARNPPLSIEAVEEFEREHSVSLPDDYRKYITEVADGGGGPQYGVHQLSFAYHNPWIQLGPLVDPFKLEDDSSDANYDGCLLISQRGCGGWTFLIVSGPMRGEIWYDDTVVDRGFTRASDSFLSWFADWLASSLEKTAGQVQDESGDLVSRLMELAESAPERLGELLAHEPDEMLNLSRMEQVAMSFLQGNRPNAALPIYQRLLQLPAPDESGARMSYLHALNNGIIAACMTQDFAAATAISDQAQPFVRENPYISHSAACAYMGVGDQSKALEQCRLAVELGYEHLDRLQVDEDLAPLHDNPDFQKLFED